MRTQLVFPNITWLAQFCALVLAAVSTEAANSGIITFQDGSGTSSENSNRLIGHWRKTTIGYTGPIDEHLVLHVDGTVENWTATATSAGSP